MLYLFRGREKNANYSFFDIYLYIMENYYDIFK